MKSTFACAVILAGLCGIAWSEVPSSQPSDGSVDIRDYCTVLLATKLQDRLAVTDEQRHQLADMKSKLYAYLDNAAGNIHGPRVTPGLIAARAETVLHMVGQMVHDELTPGQRATLAALFDDKTLEPIQVSAAVETGTGFGSRSVVTGVHLDYTHYGESGQAEGTSTAAPPTTRPAGPAVSAPPATRPSAVSQGRHRRNQQAQIAEAIQQLKSDTNPLTGAVTLGIAVKPEDQSRGAVLEALRPYVQDPTDEHWVIYVNTYCQWADAGERETLEMILSASKRRHGFNQMEEPAAMACAALLSIETQAALREINAHVSSDLFRVHLLSDVQRMPGFADASSAILRHVFDQLMGYEKGMQITAGD